MQGDDFGGRKMAVTVKYNVPSFPKAVIACPLGSDPAQPQALAYFTIREDRSRHVSIEVEPMIFGFMFDDSEPL